MKQIIFLAVSILIGSAAFAANIDKPAAVAEAKSIAQQLGGSLRNELVGAMQSGGPINGLEVCNLEAMPITAGVSEDRKVDVSRVSLKNRNSENAPNDWQQLVLEDFNKRAAAGEAIDTMGSVEFVETDNATQLRFMKAVPTGGACLACHGQQLDTQLQAKINELYPDDKATGYSLGDVRGAIVVVKNLEHE
ncbi:DUF3365 domain-containing protein [Granulosicoccus sp.]|nr:DUF3365 domain-containing protein [Granulosicoccus sp.]MDB4223847.1 DUF3365 domain-containing protein [Granulosicoccus sp.]